jgi:NAD(P)-dependent dehydrogenase (short-subunit alcohol dehydrogenase family)
MQRGVARPVALVTGASRGIGAATAREFARRGYDVTISARGEDGLGETAAAVEAAGGNGLALAGDLAEPGDLEFARSLVDRTVERFGRIDVVVNNAAWREMATLRTIGLDSWERTIRIGLTVPAFLSRWAAEHMERAGRGGVIVNVSSIQSKRAAGFAPAYVAAKGGLDALTGDLAALYGPSGIRAVAINPGPIDTEMNADYFDPSGDSLKAQTNALVEDMVPLRRSGRPEEIARAIAWLASDEASYLTGTTVVVDGGWSTQHSPYSLKRLMFPGEF